LAGLDGTGNGLVNLTGPASSIFESASSIFAEGSETFDNATINIGAASGTAVIDNVSVIDGDYNDASVPGAVLTLGTNLIVNHAGLNAALSGEGLFTFVGSTFSEVGFGGSGIINAGTINAGFNGGSFTIDPTSFTNQGTIHSSNGDTVMISSPNVTNTGKLWADGGNVVVGSPLGGAGTEEITGAGVMEFAGAVASGQTVTFDANSTGTLKLDNSPGFAGTVSGLALGNYIDLTDVQFASLQAPTYTPNADNTGGTLTVTDGQHTANIALLGQYMAGSFATSADGHGGTLITEHPAAGVDTASRVTAPPLRRATHASPCGRSAASGRGMPRRSGIISFREAECEIGQRGRRERLFGPTLHNGRPAVTGRAGMDPGDAPVRIDYPEFANAMAGIQARLDFAVIAHARNGDLDQQQDVLRTGLRKCIRGNVVDRLRDNGEVRLHENVVGELNCCRGSRECAIGCCRHEPNVQCVFNAIVRHPIVRHHNDIALDQLKAFIPAEDARLHHPADIAHGECATRQTVSRATDRNAHAADSIANRRVAAELRNCPHIIAHPDRCGAPLAPATRNDGGGRVLKWASLDQLCQERPGRPGRVSSRSALS
jgi:hypothetical protein